MKFCGEITYGEGVHSDICFDCNPRTEHKTMNKEYIAFLHNCLDEWLNNSNGNGAFWIGDPEYFKTWKEENS